MKEKLVIGTRQSALALWQANFVKEALEYKYPGLVAEKKPIVTKGDKILSCSLAKIGGKGLFTKELEEAMLRGEIDLAVHSLKDMPAVLPPGLTIAAVTKREMPEDAFISNKYSSFAELPNGALVGTSSLRRKAQLLHLRPDLDIRDLRGNVDTRLKKLDAGEFDAVVLAAAGLVRLGKEGRIGEIFSPDLLLPAASQGALAIETSTGSRACELTRFLTSRETAICTEAERAFLKEVGGGCQVPVGVYGKVGDGKLRLTALIASVDGKKFLKSSKVGNTEENLSMGRDLARELLAAGGREILAELGL